MENDIEKKEIPDEIPGDPRCNCNDPYITKPCPIHGKKSMFNGDKLQITDEHWKGYGTYAGYIFECPECKTPSIMVNEDMGNRCCVCGKEVEIRSTLLTNAIRRHYE